MPTDTLSVTEQVLIGVLGVALLVFLCTQIQYQHQRAFLDANLPSAKAQLLAGISCIESSREHQKIIGDNHSMRNSMLFGNKSLSSCSLQPRPGKGRAEETLLQPGSIEEEEGEELGIGRAGSPQLLVLTRIHEITTLRTRQM